MKKITIALCVASLILIANTVALGFMMSKGESVFGNATWTSLGDIFGIENHDKRPGSGALADFNADGNLDFAYFKNYFDPSSVEVVVLFGNGAGQFPSHTTQILNLEETMPEDSYWVVKYGLKVGDTNSDGYTDLVVPIYGTQEFAGDYGILVLLNQGNGSFVCATDINGDSNTDITDLLEVVSGWGPCE